jgi:formylglycine-generating enzyme required for sulfatase activity
VIARFDLLGGMMRKLSWMFLLFLTVSLWAVEGDEVENQEPVVSNPLAKQLDYEHVLVTYDVEDVDGDLMTVSIKVSDDGGKTFGFTAPMEQLSGDVGEGVSSGKGKEIVWTIAVDEFLHVYGENFVIRVLADDGVGLAEKIVWEKDGSEMMRIPAGSFEMGDHLDAMSNALPVHTVALDGFYMDVHEVTVGQFREFVNQSGYNYGVDWDTVAKYSPGDEYPMERVTWYDATAYAKWAGKRLPTEAEWEYAARGGLVGKRYPGGDEITHDDANWGNTISGKDKWRYCSPVGSFAANGYGLYDMAGNVWEWCQDRYGGDYYSNSPTKNPPGPDTGSRRVLRGGFWGRSASYLRVAYRSDGPPTGRPYGSGFRCVSGSK